MCACAFESMSLFQSRLWHVAQNFASGSTRPAALAFSRSFIVARVLYSLPGPWQFSQSSGGDRRACGPSDQEANWSLWQILHFSGPIRVALAWVDATATVPPGSSTFEAAFSGGAGTAAGAGLGSLAAGCGSLGRVGDGDDGVALFPGASSRPCARSGAGGGGVFALGGIAEVVGAD